MKSFFLLALVMAAALTGCAGKGSTNQTVAPAADTSQSGISGSSAAISGSMSGPTGSSAGGSGPGGR